MFAFSSDWEYEEINAKDFYVANNILNISAFSGNMVEALYIDSIVDSIVENNIVITNTGESVTNYGIALTDSFSYAYNYYGDAIPPYNVTIRDNDVILNSADMAYGITAISWFDRDGWGDHYDKNIMISNNNVKINSEKGAIGIGAQTNDVIIRDNFVNINANPDAVITASPDPTFGSNSYAIFIANSDENNGEFYNNTAYNNFIYSNVEPIKVANDGPDNQPLIVVDNFIADCIINDDNYATYFNEDGTIKEDSGIVANSKIILGDLTNKKLVIDIPLAIIGMPNTSLVNTTVDLVAGADGTYLSDLDFYYEDDGSSTFAIISINDGVSDVYIVSSNINTVSAPGWNYNMAISVYGSEEGSKNIYILDNNITMTGDSYGLYGIDAQDYNAYWSKQKATDGLYVLRNNIFLSGPGMVEPIYVAGCNDVQITSNNIRKHYYIFIIQIL